MRRSQLPPSPPDTPPMSPGAVDELQRLRQSQRAEDGGPALTPQANTQTLLRVLRFLVSVARNAAAEILQLLRAVYRRYVAAPLALLASGLPELRMASSLRISVKQRQFLLGCRTSLGPGTGFDFAIQSDLGRAHAAGDASLLAWPGDAEPAYTVASPAVSTPAGAAPRAAAAAQPMPLLMSPCARRRVVSLDLDSSVDQGPRDAAVAAPPPPPPPPPPPSSTLSPAVARHAGMDSLGDALRSHVLRHVAVPAGNTPARRRERSPLDPSTPDLLKALAEQIRLRRRRITTRRSTRAPDPESDDSIELDEDASGLPDGSHGNDKRTRYPCRVGSIADAIVSDEEDDDDDDDDIADADGDEQAYDEDDVATPPPPPPPLSPSPRRVPLREVTPAQLTQRRRSSLLNQGNLSPRSAIRSLSKPDRPTPTPLWH